MGSIGQDYIPGRRSLAAARGVAGAGEDVYRIDRTDNTLWTVTRPGASLPHGFIDLGDAVAFIRHESAGMPATVELRVGGVYAVAYLRPGEAHSLFGEAA